MRHRRCIVAATFLIILLGVAAAQDSPNTIPSSPTRKEATMKSHATGTFEVKTEPQSEEKVEGATLGRTLLSKQFHGGLEGSSKVEMLTAMTATKGSAGYVAIEHFTGTLDGHTGSFVLQHSGTMNRGVPQLTITVVPDSGTGQLAGLSGRLSVNIAEGKHSYDFEYTLQESH